MARLTTHVLLPLLLFVLLVYALPAGAQTAPIPREGARNLATPGLEGVTLGHGTRPAIRPLSGEGASVSHSPGASNYTAENWSGYVVSGGDGTVTGVNGSWIVPSVTCSSIDAYAASWIGIDGFSPHSETVEQIGTDSDCSGGTPIYYAWYEFYPQNPVYIGSVPVQPGDVISANVSCITTGPQCSVSIEDISGNSSFDTTWAFGPFGILGSPILLSSAEWIVEAPSSFNGTVLPLANFGKVGFGADFTGVNSTDFVTVNGVSGPLDSFGGNVSEVTMTSDGLPSGRVKAQPSALSPDGASFSVAWESGAIPLLIAGAVTPKSPSVLVGGQVQLTASPSGGVPPYSVAWYEASAKGPCSASDNQTAVGSTYSPSPTVSTYFCYVVTDAESPPSTASSQTDLVTVLPPLSPAVVTASPGLLFAGQSALLSISSPFAGGLIPYSCQWLELPPSASNFSDLGPSFTSGCRPSGKPSVSTGALTMVGNWSFELQVTDETGATVVSPPTTLSVEALVSPVVYVSCTPSAVVVGSSARCSVTVQGSGPASSFIPTGTVTWSTGSLGTFARLSCKLSKGSCSVKFIPSAAGLFVGLLASYGGDARNLPSTTAYVLSVFDRSSKTVVSCVAKGVSAGSSKTGTCKATVSGYSPTGTVSWSEGGSGGLSFTNSTCVLSGGSCSVNLNGTQPGAVTVQASYDGDSNNGGSSGTAGVKVGKEPGVVTIECSPTVLAPGSPLVCTAMVSGYSPTGSVTWSKVSGSVKVTLSSKSCALTSSPSSSSEGASSCTIAILTSSSGAGVVSIKASYGGDGNNLKGSATIELVVA